MTTASALVLLLGWIPVLQGCGNEGPPGVAVLLPLSGSSATFGAPVQRGVLLARDTLRRDHEKGLYPYELQIVIQDTKGDPDLAANLLRELYDHGVVAAIGGVTDPEAAALAEVAEEAERVLISPTASRPDLPNSRHFFRVFLTADREATKMASFSALELGLREAVILAAETPTAGVAARLFAV